LRLSRSLQNTLSSSSNKSRNRKKSIGKRRTIRTSCSHHLTDAEQAANQKAIKEVISAKRAGEKKGAKAAEAIIKKQKSQTPKQNEKDIQLLQRKLENTSKQVMKIIQNFGNVHKDLQELKNEYIQS
jgi:hypothetical protein